MTPRPRVGLLGGTFDPVHNGHLAAARAAQHTLGLDIVRFIPSARPPHRPDSPIASEYHRLQMLRLAVEDPAVAKSEVQWEVSDLELRREGPSFTYDTLSALHAEGLTPLQIFFIIGADAFAEIATWSRYPAVLDAANFAVVARPGFTLESLRQQLPSVAPRMVSSFNFADLAQPRVVLIESSTPHISSTDIRRRAAAGDDLDGLVPSRVAAYIAQERLYRRTPESSAAAGPPPIPGTPGAPSGR